MFIVCFNGELRDDGAEYSVFLDGEIGEEVEDGAVS